MRVGLIGLGAIGGAVARLVRERYASEVEIIGALVRSADRARAGVGVPTLASLPEMLARRPDVVVEVAGHGALRTHGPAVLDAGVDLIAVSVGALADAELHRDLLDAARRGRARLRIASGAIGALDALGAAALAGLDRVVHTTRKPPRALLPEDEAAAVDVARELFRGPAREGVRRFPENVNVAAAIALAGIGFDRTELRVIADPAVDRNCHEVLAEGTFGSFRFEIANVPSDENSRTGRIVAFSVVRALLDRRAAIVIG